MITMVNENNNCFVNIYCCRFTTCTNLYIYCWQGLAHAVVSHHQHQNFSYFGLSFLSNLFIQQHQNKSTKSTHIMRLLEVLPYNKLQSVLTGSSPICPLLYVRSDLSATQSCKSIISSNFQQISLSNSL